MTDSPRDREPGNDPGSTIPATFLLRNGERLGPYVLREKIGEGGMGEVWRADQTAPIRRQVALKLIKPGMDSREVVHRFEAERQALALMDHPCIARVYDASVTPAGRPYFAMEYVRGIRITEYCDQRFMTTQDRLRLFQRVCEAVHHAHQKAILHRDLKPSNILVADLDEKPEPKIIDFGVAKATAFKLTDETMYTAMGQLVGTPEYMSPEQADVTCEDVDTRSDVYSLGVILYELLTGALPFDPTHFRSRGLEGIVRVLRDEEPPRPSTKVSTLDDEREELARRRQTGSRQLIARLQGDLDWIVMRCLEKDRNRRYGSALGLAKDIQRYLDHNPVEARPPSFNYRAGKFVRRHKLGVGIGLAAIVVLVAFSITTMIQATRIAAERDRASREAAVSSEATDFLVHLFEISDPRAARGNTVTARELLDRGASRVQEEIWTDSQVQSRLVTVMGQAYTGLGLSQEARPLYEQALVLSENDLGHDDPATLDARFNVGMNAFQTGDYDTAVAILRDVKENRERVLGSEHRDTAKSTQELAHVLRNRGDREEAEPLYEEALALQRTILGEEDPETAETENQLGILYWSQGRYAEAEPLIVHSLAATEKALGADHPMTLTFRNNMAAFEQTATHWEDPQPHRARAEQLYLEVIEAQQRILGPDHPETLRTIYNLGSLLVNQERLAEAEVLLRQAAEGRKRVLGPTHRATLMAQTDIAYVLRRSGQSREAEELLREILGHQQNVLEPYHREIRGTLNALFTLLVEEERFADARPVMTELIEILEYDAGRDSASAEAHDRYARMLATCELEEFRDSALALRHAARAVEMSQGRNPDYLLTLAYAQSLDGDDAQAYATVTSALELLPPDHEDRPTFETERVRFARRGGVR